MQKYSEKDLESFIEKHLLNSGYIKRQSDDYDKSYGIDTQILFEFLHSTQQDKLDELSKRIGNNYEQKLLKRLSSEIGKRGVLDVLKKGFSENGINFSTIYPKPNSFLNDAAIQNYLKNKFSIIRQLYFSTKTKESIDIVIFINGLSIATIELKNPFTMQSTDDAKLQYMHRNPNEAIFKHSIVHFALDSENVYMSTKIEGRNTRFLPFNKGLNDGLSGIDIVSGAGNPPSDGVKTAYLWERFLSKDVLNDIILNYIQIIEDKKTKTTIFPRYHQFDVVDKLLKDCKENNVGKRYLIQHSAGSGKSNSIAWLALNLINLQNDNKAIFDSVIVITDRRILDKQLRDNLKSFYHKDGVIEAITKGSNQLKIALEEGKKIIISTIQKFPFVVEKISHLKSKTFAVIIDEAHSSQSGQMASKLGETIRDKNESCDYEDVLLEQIRAKKLQKNASYFAFTATPKPKTLETFGTECVIGDETKYFPYHLYSMKQAIEEGYILDVLKGYITYESFYKLKVAFQANKEYDEKKAQAKLKKFVESSEITIEKKAKIMCEHFYTNTYMQISSKAKAMVVANSRLSALKYYFAFENLLKTYHPKFKALIAFSGELNYNGCVYTETMLNQISENNLKSEFKKDEYRFLIVADKYQTGFDEPLLHTMYIDKPLNGVSTVQTLSRLNRTCKNKYNTCVIDFANSCEDIQQDFSKFYEVSHLKDKTDANKIFDLKDNIMAFMFFTQNELDEFVKDVLDNKDESIIHSKLDMIAYRINSANEDEKYDFYQKCKNYNKIYSFLSQILPYDDLELEKLYMFLGKLIYKITIEHQELERDLLANVDFDSYRVQLKGKMDIKLQNQGEFLPSNADGSGKKSDLILEELINIVKNFNDKHGNFEFSEDDKISRDLNNLKDDILENQTLLQSIDNFDRQNTKLTFNDVLNKSVQDMIDRNFAFFQMFNNNKEFQNIISEKLFEYVVEERRKETI